MKLMKIAFCVLSACLLMSCMKETENSALSCTPATKKVAWSRDAVVYEVNVRQFTNEGTFNALTQQLPYLKDLGVDVLWLMPIHPISELNRKGEDGSYYAIQDYKKVNPKFGTMADFDLFVAEAHKLGLKVILDWVANHSGCDNPWLAEHPDWYKYNEDGSVQSPWDWTDTYQLNYDNPALQDAMVDAMEFWVEEHDIDGYRCDVAFLVPVEFWNKVRKKLDAIKPVFMLAEADQPNLAEHAFDMEYNWKMMRLFEEVYKEEKGPKDIFALVDTMKAQFPCDTYLLNQITNHDYNTWEGTEFERLGASVPVFAMLSYTLNGVPLLYTGQEVGMDRRLLFFKKDQAPSKEKNEYFKKYKKLNALKHEQAALKAGVEGGKFKQIVSTADSAVLVFSRYLDSENEVIVFANLNKDFNCAQILSELPEGEFTNYYTGEKVTFTREKRIELPSFQFEIFVK